MFHNKLSASAERGPLVCFDTPSNRCLERLGKVTGRQPNGDLRVQLSSGSVLLVEQQDVLFEVGNYTREKTLADMERDGLRIAVDYWNFSEGIYSVNLLRYEDGEDGVLLNLEDIRKDALSDAVDTVEGRFAAAVLISCDPRFKKVLSTSVEGTDQYLYRFDSARCFEVENCNERGKAYAFLLSLYDRRVSVFKECLNGHEFLEYVETLQFATRALSLPPRYCLRRVPSSDESREVYQTKRLQMEKWIGQQIQATEAQEMLKCWGYHTKFDATVLFDMAGIRSWKVSGRSGDGSYNFQEQREALGEARMLLGRELTVDHDERLRTDMTHLHAICIDNDDTQDPDDAFSYGKLSATDELGLEYLHVHITDVARYFREGVENTPLFEEASRRGLTCYFPDGVNSMLPIEITTQMLSFGAERSDHSALTFSFRMSGSSLDESSYKVQLSKIQKPHLMTYTEAEALLDSEGDGDAEDTIGAEIRKVYDVAITGARRMAEEDYCKVKTKPIVRRNMEKEAIELKYLSATPKARSLVSQLMKTANTVCGLYGSRHEIPLVYRGIRGGAVYMRWPIPHLRLGTRAYAMATSPVRRLGDLINHLQIKDHMRWKASRGEGVYLEANRRRIESVSLRELISVERNVHSIEKRLNTYFLFKELGRKVQQGQSEWEGKYVGYGEATDNYDPTTNDIVLGDSVPGMNYHIVELEGSGIRLLSRIDAEISVGGKLRVKITAIDADSMEHSVSSRPWRNSDRELRSRKRMRVNRSNA